MRAASVGSPTRDREMTKRGRTRRSLSWRERAINEWADVGMVSAGAIRSESREAGDGPLRCAQASYGQLHRGQEPPRHDGTVHACWFGQHQSTPERTYGDSDAIAATEGGTAKSV